MKHIFIEGKNQAKPTLLLLHGTGGTERDLISIAQKIDEEASVLSVRGNVLENGMPRFFRRIAEGVFDIEDLKFRTKELNEFLDEAAQTYNFDRESIFAIGYSNGANIAASLLYLYENALHGAILHHPMVPLKDKKPSALLGKHVFIAAGTNDPLIPSSEPIELQSLLKQAGASVMLHWEDQGHQLTMSEVEAAAKWYKKIAKEGE